MAKLYLNRKENERCTAVITLRDGSKADCQRYRQIGTLCKQHAAIAERMKKPAGP